VVKTTPKNVELTLTALEDYNLTNEVVVARDGKRPWTISIAGAASRCVRMKILRVMLLDLKLPKIDGLECCSRSSREKLKLIPWWC